MRHTLGVLASVALSALLGLVVSCGDQADPNVTVLPRPIPSPRELYGDVVIPSTTLSAIIYERLAPLGTDGVLDADDQSVLDAVKWVGQGMIPEGIRLAHYRFPLHLARYQLRLIQPLLEDSQVSASEIDALRTLMDPVVWSRWHLARDIVSSGMIGDSQLDEDWDQDGISNAEEISAGTNPLNEMETSPDNLSERFIVLINGTNHGTTWNPSAANVLYAYHTAKRNGYGDDNILLFIQTNDDPLEIEYNPRVLESWNQNLLQYRPVLANDPAILQLFLEVEKSGLKEIADTYPQQVLKPSRWEGLYEDMDLLTEPVPANIDYRDTAVDTVTFLNRIRTLPADSNDLITIVFAGHGNGGSLYVNPDNNLFPDQINEALQQLSYGRLLWISLASFNEIFVTQLAPQGDAILVASNASDESAGTNPAWIVEVLYNLDVGAPIKSAGRSVGGRGPDGVWRSTGDRFYLWALQDGKQRGFYSGKFAPDGGGDFGDTSVADWTNPLIYLRNP